jgi:Dirigent-like protein
MMSTLTARLNLASAQQRRRLAVAAVAVGVVGAASSAAAAPPATSRSQAVRVITVYAFPIGGPFLAVPGTNPKVLSQGDEILVNDQLTVTRQRKGGYPIIGHDSGTCTFTRILSPHEGLADCVATAVLHGGSLTAQGVVEISSTGTPQPSDLAVTGGTGTYVGARGTLHQRNTTNHAIYTITLQNGIS